MSAIHLDYLCSDRDRHGTTRYYVRKNGRKIRLRAEPPSDEFMRQYYNALSALNGSEAKILSKDTLAWLVKQYLESPQFKALELVTQTGKINVLQGICAEPFEKHTYGDCPIAVFSKKHVQVLMDRKATPDGANARLKQLSALFAWAVKREIMPFNPATGVEKMKTSGQGWHTWTEEEIRQFTKRHPIGTMPYLALAVMLFTGCRRSDAYVMGRQHLKGNVLEFRPRKTRKAKAQTVVTFDAPPQLLHVISVTPGAGDLTFIQKEEGGAFASAGSFGQSFGRWCEQAGLPHCSAHGLRKALASILAEEGASERQLMAVGGWSTPSMVSEYVKKANNRKMASSALSKLKPNLLGGEDE